MILSILKDTWIKKISRKEKQADETHPTEQQQLFFLPDITSVYMGNANK